MGESGRDDGGRAGELRGPEGPRQGRLQGALQVAHRPARGGAAAAPLAHAPPTLTTLPQIGLEVKTTPTAELTETVEITADPEQELEDEVRPSY